MTSYHGDLANSGLPLNTPRFLLNPSALGEKHRETTLLLIWPKWQTAAAEEVARISRTCWTVKLYLYSTCSNFNFGYRLAMREKVLETLNGLRNMELIQSSTLTSTSVNCFTYLPQVDNHNVSCRISNNQSHWICPEKLVNLRNDN